MEYKGIKGDWTLIPAHMWDGLHLYITEGIEPGSFLSAVLQNDLRRACEAADDVNRHRLRDYVQFLYCHAPHDCWGSPEKYSAWIKRGGLNARITKRDV